MRVPLEGRHEPDREERQDDDPVRECEAIPAVRELAGNEPVPREKRGEPGEVREARVGRQDEDQHRHTLDEVVERRLAEDEPGELGVHRLPFHGHDAEGVRERGDAEEEHDEDAAQRQQHAAGGLGLRRPEGGHAVGDGLDPGHRGAPRREGPEDQEGGQRVAAAGRHRRRCDSGRPAEPLEPAPADQQEVGAEEQIGGQGEEPTRFAHAAEVPDRDDGHADDAQRHPIGVERPDRRRDRRDPGGDAHRDGEDVVDHERRPGDEARIAAEVLAGDDVGPAPLGVREDRLPVGAHDDRDEDGDGHGDRERESASAAEPASIRISRISSVA